MSILSANRHVFDEPSRFGVWVRPADGRTVVHLSGELDIAAGRTVGEALGRAANLGAPTTVIDVSRVTFIDACVIGLIIKARSSATERGALLGVSGVAGHVAELFAVLGLGDLVLTAANGGDAEGDGHGRG